VKKEKNRQKKETPLIHPFSIPGPETACLLANFTSYSSPSGVQNHQVHHNYQTRKNRKRRCNSKSIIHPRLIIHSPYLPVPDWSFEEKEKKLRIVSDCYEQQSKKPDEKKNSHHPVLIKVSFRRKAHCSMQPKQARTEYVKKEEIPELIDP